MCGIQCANTVDMQMHRMDCNYEQSIRRRSAYSRDLTLEEERETRNEEMKGLSDTMVRLTLAETSPNVNPVMVDAVGVSVEVEEHTSGQNSIDSTTADDIIEVNVDAVKPVDENKLLLHNDTAVESDNDVSHVEDKGVDSDKFVSITEIDAEIICDLKRENLELRQAVEELRLMMNVTQKHHIKEIETLRENYKIEIERLDKHQNYNSEQYREVLLQKESDMKKKDEQIRTTQEDNSYLRTENFKLKSERKAAKENKSSSASSTSTEESRCHCCETTVRGLADLKKQLSIMFSCETVARSTPEPEPMISLHSEGAPKEDTTDEFEDVDNDEAVTTPDESLYEYNTIQDQLNEVRRMGHQKFLQTNPDWEIKKKKERKRSINGKTTLLVQHGK